MKPLNCPYFVTARGVKDNFQGKKLPCFFDQTTWVLAVVFCMATI